MRLRALTITAMAVAMAMSGCQSNKETMEKKETTVIDAIMSRRSIRHYTDEPVSRELLQKIAECGINAPNASNKQEWEVRIIDDKAYLDSVTTIIKEVLPFFVNTEDPKFRNGFRNATAVFAIACPDDPYGMNMLNIGFLGENICLTAQELGLGTCVMGGPSVVLNTSEKAKPYLDKLGFSEGYKLRYVIGVGYPDEAPDAKPRDLNKIKFVE